MDSTIFGCRVESNECRALTQPSLSLIFCACVVESAISNLGGAVDQVTSSVAQMNDALERILKNKVTVDSLGKTLVQIDHVPKKTNASFCTGGTSRRCKKSIAMMTVSVRAISK